MAMSSLSPPDDSTATNEPPSLLTIPPELRLRILRYALLPPSSTEASTAVSISYNSVAKGYAKTLPDKYWWGTSRMSSILAINRQLHLEAEDVLYKTLPLSFQHYVNARDLREHFLNRISPRAKFMIRHIIVVVLAYGNQGQSTQIIAQSREAFKMLAHELPGLRRVGVHAHFVGGEVAQSAPSKLAGVIVDLAKVFRHVAKVEVLYGARQDGGFPRRKKIAELAQARVENGDW